MRTLQVMAICPACARDYPQSVKFCPEDGTALPAAPDPLVGTTLLDQFELRERCGAGSMGTVYRAWQRTMERDVAVKVLREDVANNERIRKRFFREARAIARVAHPHIVTVYLVAELDDGRPFLLMEYVKGQKLEQLCASGPLPCLQAIRIARQITAALAEAHAHDIIHRDLKPANILIGQRQTLSDFVTVVDFGIAKILYEEGHSKLTQAGAIFGTPSYIAPEQAIGEVVDARCDLYALGVVLYRMVTGRVPFESDDGMEVLIQHLKQPPTPPRQLLDTIPRSVEDLILRALQKRREDRWQSAEELDQALFRIDEELRREGKAAHPTPVQQTRSGSSALPTGHDGQATELDREPPWSSSCAEGDAPRASDHELAAAADPAPATPQGEPSPADTGLLRARLLERPRRTSSRYAIPLALLCGIAVGAIYTSLHPFGALERRATDVDPSGSLRATDASSAADGPLAHPDEGQDLGVTVALPAGVGSRDAGAHAEAPAAGRRRLSGRRPARRRLPRVPAWDEAAPFRPAAEHLPSADGGTDAREGSHIDDHRDSIEAPPPADPRPLPGEPLDAVPLDAGGLSPDADPSDLPPVDPELYELLE